MKRQSAIYFAFSIAAALLAIYLLSAVSTSWEQFGFSPTTLLFTSAQVLLAGLSIFFVLASLLFYRRGVLEISFSGSVATLILAIGREEQVSSLSPIKLFRRIGDQLHDPMSKPSFAVFRANSKFWVAEASVFDNAVRIRSAGVA